MIQNGQEKFNKKMLFVMHVDVIHPLIEFYNNSGDTVYFSAGASFFWNQNVTYILISELQKRLAENKTWVKDNFDIVIMMEACIFCEIYNTTMKEMGQLIKIFGVPTYVLGAGVHSPIDYSEEFLSKISDNAKYYVDSVLSSGGTITLRGNFTKHCLNILGYKDLFVTGCPSLYINGKNFSISNQKVSIDTFRPMLSASKVQDINKKIYTKYPQSCYFDQDYYLKYMYHPEIIKNNKNIHPLFKKLYKQNRIFGYMNYIMWKRKILKSNFNFSYGSRIHGNIIALQQKIPAFVKIIDSRTREIAEFYKIPNSIDIDYSEKNQDLYDLYKSLNYEEFNRNYLEKYNNFSKFLLDRDIPNNLGDSENFIEYLNGLNYYDLETDESVQKIKERVCNNNLLYNLKNIINIKKH